MINNKGINSISALLTALVIFAGINIGLESMFNEVSTAYSVNKNGTTFYNLSGKGQYNDTAYGLINDTNSIAQNIEKKGSSDFQVGIESVINVIRLTFRSINIFDNILSAVNFIPGVKIPEWFIDMASATLTIFLIFALATMIFKVKT